MSTIRPDNHTPLLKTPRHRLLFLAALAAVIVLFAAVVLSDEIVAIRTVYTSMQQSPGGSPVGQWAQPGGGPSLELSDSGRFTAQLSSGPVAGQWQIRGGELCLTPTGKDATCYAYDLRGDVLTLDDAIYTRQ